MQKLVNSLVFILFFLSAPIASQTGKIDSLNKLLPTIQHDSLRLKLLLQLCEECEIKDNLKYAVPAIELADKLALISKEIKQKNLFLEKKAEALSYVAFYYQESEGLSSEKILDAYKKQSEIYLLVGHIEKYMLSLRRISLCYGYQGNIQKQLKCLKESYELAEKTKNTDIIMSFAGALRDLYSELNDSSMALKYVRRILEIRLKNNTDTLIPSILIKIGYNYLQFNDTTRAKFYFHRGLEQYTILKDSSGICWANFSLGRMYKEKGVDQTAIDYFLEALRIAEQTNSKDIKNDCNANIALSYLNLRQPLKALPYAQKAIAQPEMITDKFRIAFYYSILSRIYFNLKQYNQAKKFSDSCLTIQLKRGIQKDMLFAEHLAAQTDSAVGDYKSAYFHYQRYSALKEIMRQEDIKKIILSEKYENLLLTEKTEQEKKDLINKEEIRQKKVQRNYFIVGFIFVLFLALFILRGFYQKKKANLELSEKNQTIEKQKHDIEEKQKEILDSIRYARRIQSSLLPTDKYITRTLNNLEKTPKKNFKG